GATSKIVHYARGFTALGDMSTAQSSSPRVSTGTKGSAAARACVACTPGQMSQAVELGNTAKRERSSGERWRAELASGQGATPQLEPVEYYRPVKNRVLHVLINSLPHTPSGYAQRSHSIMQALQDKGWDVSAVTRIGWPITTGALFADSHDVVDGIG